MRSARFLFHLSLWVLLLSGWGATGLRAAKIAATWTAIDLPATGVAGETLRFSARVTNAGDVRWEDGTFAEVKDDKGARLAQLALGRIATGATASGMFALKLPTQPGIYELRFGVVASRAGVAEGTLTRFVIVHSPVVDVRLALKSSTVHVGEITQAQSQATPAGTVIRHGLEGRLPRGAWQIWAVWNDPAGRDHVAFPAPATPGTYETRAYAARTDGLLAYSPVSTLIVVPIAPTITQQPAATFVGASENVTFSVSATGTAPMYQWRRDGAPVAGATSASYRIVGVQPADAGEYSVVVSNEAGSATSRSVALTVAVPSLPAVTLQAWHFPTAGVKAAVGAEAARTGDVVTITSLVDRPMSAGWRHNVLIRRPAIAIATALAPEDGSGLHETVDAWNKEGWGTPHNLAGAYDPTVLGRPMTDLGQREPFTHVVPADVPGATRGFDLVLDAPGTWLFKTEVLDASGTLIAVSAASALTVGSAPLAGDPAEITYPYGRRDRHVGVFWNAGQAHRLWTSWRADHQNEYRSTWANNWRLMWQPSPYFSSRYGGWTKLNPAADSPWQAFWSAHYVYAMVPDGRGGSVLSHDLTSQAFAEKAALRLMDVGVDFVTVDYTNQFLERQEDVLPAVHNLALAFQAVARRTQSGEAPRLSALLPGNLSSGNWAAHGGFGPEAQRKFAEKLTNLYERYARYETAWFYLEDDDGRRKPLIMLWIGAGGEENPDGTVPAEKLAQLKLTDGRALTEVFTLRWVGAYMTENSRFVSGRDYRVDADGNEVRGKFLHPKLWSYREYFPGGAAPALGADAAAGLEVEAITVQPDAAGRDRFGRAWRTNWAEGEGFHYETPLNAAAVPLNEYGRLWQQALHTARALKPKFILTTWCEFGSENDEPRPEMSATIMDNNKFGTHFGDAMKAAVRQFKYRAPEAWIDTFAIEGGAEGWFNQTPAVAWSGLRGERGVKLRGWVSPNVATTFAGGSVRVLVDGRLCGEARVGGAWNNATRWEFTLSAEMLPAGAREIVVEADDGVGGVTRAGVQFLGERPSSALSVGAVRE